MRSAVYARVIRMDPAFFEVTRVGEVLSRLTADTTLVQSIAGVNLSIMLRSTITVIGSLVMLGVTSLKLTSDPDRADPADRRAADHPRPPRAQAFAQVAGPHRRYQRHRGRDAQCDPDGAGLHARADQHRPLRRRGRGLVRRSGATHEVALHADRARHDAGVRRDHVRALDGRACRRARRDDRRRSSASSCCTPGTSASPRRASARCGARCSAQPARWSA